MATLIQNILHDSESFSCLKSNNATLAIEVHLASRFLCCWYHLNDHSFASTLAILIRILHNQDMICIFVVFEAQLLVIPVAKDIDSPRFYFSTKNWKFREKSMCTMQNRAFRMGEISLAWATSLKEFKTSLTFGGPAGSLGHPDRWPRWTRIFYMTRKASLA